MMVNDMLTSDTNANNQPSFPTTPPPNHSEYNDKVSSPLQRTKAFTLTPSIRSPKNLLVQSSSVEEDVVMTERENQELVDNVQDYEQDDYDDEEEDDVTSPTLSITTPHVVGQSGVNGGVGSRLSESSTISDATTDSNSGKLFPTMNLLDLSVLNKKPKLTSVMQHSFMITPKRIGSNLVNSYDQSSTTHKPHHQTEQQQPMEDVDIDLSPKLNLERLKNMTLHGDSQSKSKRHERNISFSKEVDSQVTSDDEDDATLNMSGIGHRGAHTKTTSFVQPFFDDFDDDLSLNIGTVKKQPTAMMMTDEDELSIETFPSASALIMSQNRKQVPNIDATSVNMLNQRCLTDDNSDSPGLMVKPNHQHHLRHNTHHNDGGLLPQQHLTPNFGNQLSPHNKSSPSPRSPNGKSISFMMPSTLKSGANPYHYNKHCIASRPPVYSLERHVLTSPTDENSDIDLSKHQLDSIFENMNSHECTRLIQEFEELEEIDMVTWMHKRLYFRSGLKYMDMNRYSNVLPNDDTRFKFYKGIGPILHVAFTNLAQTPFSNFALLANPSSVMSSASTTTAATNNPPPPNNGSNNNRVVSPTSEIFTSWEEDYINANIIKSRKVFLFDWEEFSINSSPLSITGSNADSVNTNYGTSRKEREELAERVNMVDYICTQGPLPYTASHFWRMIYQSNSHLILMIGKEQEDTGVKCAIYYPTPSTGSGNTVVSLSSTLTTSSSLDGVSPRNMLNIPGMKNGCTDTITIDVTPPKCIPNQQKWKLEITIPKKETGDEEEAVKWLIPKELVQRVVILKLKRSKLGSNEEDDILDVRRIHLLQYVGWADQGVPHNISIFQKVIEHVNEHVERRKNDILSLSPLSSIMPSITMDPHKQGERLLDKVGPIVVHCSAGIGRTGTFCAVDCALKQFKAHIIRHVPAMRKQSSSPLSSRTVNVPAFPFNIFNVVKKLKEHRTGMVQTENQYEFTYKAVIKCYREIMKKLNVNMLERKSNTKKEDN